MVHFFYSYASWITVPSSHAPIPHAREREADRNGFMWYKLWEQWNSCIATLGHRLVPRLNYCLCPG